jgi:hypothetical protein
VRKIFFKRLFLGALFISSFIFSWESLAQENEWPREIVTPNANIVIYQPQPETFNGNHVTARSAVSVTMKDNPEPVFGAAWYDATVATDRDNRTVQYQEVKVTDVKFPDATPEQEEKFKEVVSREMSGWKLQGSLDRLLTTLELADKEEKISSQLNNNPPVIFYSEQPAVLLLIDGKPILKPVENSEIQQVVNTAFQIFFDPSSKLFYLKGDPQWFSSSDVMGPWQVSAQVPGTVDRLGSSVDSTVSSAPGSAPPKIFVSTEPAELIQVTGAPEWATVPGTDLTYLKNSETPLFRQQPGNAYYALLSGRWFETNTAGDGAGKMGLWSTLVGVMRVAVLKQPTPDVAMEAAMAGPWSYVSGDKVPEAFRKISSDLGEQFASILASIPGTDEANDAVMDAQIPQTTVIDKKTAQFTPSYDGEPDFKSVAGTSMDYAVNTPNQIIKDGGKYYACDQGVWYVADNPEGPYQVSDTRPKDIDQLPPDNPNYNTKYVYVYDSDDDNAYVGYTAGYLGSFILGTALGASLNWGSGYYYPGWYGRYYYPRPWSYGYRPYYNPYSGGWGYRGGYGNSWYRANNNWNGNGYWGPGGYRNVEVGDVNINRVNVDRNQMSNNIYNRQQNMERNVDRDRLGQVEQKRLDKLGERGPMAGRDPSKIQGDKPNNVFADKDGNVFRKDSGGQWQRNEGKDWKNVDKPDGAGDKLASRQPEGLGDRDIGGLKDQAGGGEALKDRAGARDQVKKPDVAGKRDQVQRDRPTAVHKPASRPAPKKDVSFNKGQMDKQSHARQRGDQRAQNYQKHASQSGGGGVQRGGGRSGGGGGGGKRSGDGGGGRRR